MTVHKITPDEAYNRCPIENIPFSSTAEVKELKEHLGQERALEAVEFGISVPHQGYNLFVVGPEGSGRHSVIRSFINKKVADASPPDDWCYVYNFQTPHKPIALRFPQGQAPAFKKEMHDLIDTLKTTIPSVFEGDDFRGRKKVINDTLENKTEKLYNDLDTLAKEKSIAVIKNENGIIFTPVDEKGKPLDIAEFNKLPEKAQKEIESNLQEMKSKLQQDMHKISTYKREAQEQKRKLKKETAKNVVGHLIESLKTKYSESEKVVAYLNDVEEDITERVDDFLRQREEYRQGIVPFTPPPPSFERFDVNVLVHHDESGAPVIYEDLPTYQNLHGRCEYLAKMGTLTTNFTLIKPGSLHRANGGYIIIDARRLLMQPFAYEELKRSLRAKRISMEPVERLLGLMSTVTLEPEPIPLETKVVLIGEAMIYYLLDYYDPEFQTLFKVQADFEHDMERNAESERNYALLIADLAGQNELLPLDNQAVARIIEETARHAEDNRKLSLHISKVVDLLKESDHIARKTNTSIISADDVQSAIDAAKRRGGRIRDRYLESIDQGMRYIDTSGEKTGQINGLSVILLGSDSFGFPTRITAATRPGKEGIVDIEREVDLGGPIHSKGVMILSSYLSSCYARKVPLSLHASLVFEQSYGDVEGDSASCAELCTLLSQLAGAPIRQWLAITGSISQKGEVQPIGGCNEKIEGFFDVCNKRGLTGKEGVIIPEANVRHLMLRQDLIDALEKEQFKIYGVKNVDEAIELLTGVKAGQRDAEGNYPEDSINGRVEAQLIEYAQDLQEFEKQDKEDDEESEDA